jgi:hypothetical protein
MASLIHGIEVYIQYILANRVINNVVLIYFTRVKTISINNRNVTEEAQRLASSTYSDLNISFLYNNKEEYSNNNNYGGTIDDLDLAFGLIELLVKNNYTLDSLINTNPSELSRVLAIDQELLAHCCLLICCSDNMRCSK